MKRISEKFVRRLIKSILKEELRKSVGTPTTINKERYYQDEYEDDLIEQLNGRGVKSYHDNVHVNPSAQGQLSHRVNSQGLPILSFFKNTSMHPFTSNKAYSAVITSDWAYFLLGKGLWYRMQTVDTSTSDALNVEKMKKKWESPWRRQSFWNDNVAKPAAPANKPAEQPIRNDGWGHRMIDKLKGWFQKEGMSETEFELLRESYCMVYDVTILGEAIKR